MRKWVWIGVYLLLPFPYILAILDWSLALERVSLGRYLRLFSFGVGLGSWFLSVCYVDVLSCVFWCTIELKTKRRGKQNTQVKL